MTATNDITGDKIQSRINSRAFEDNFDRIFNQKNPVDSNTPTTNKPVEYSEDWQSESRARAIAQNGNDGQHYKEQK